MTRDANTQIKEDYEILEERFRKNTNLNEELVAGLKQEAAKVEIKLKKLQDFHDTYDVKLQEKVNEAQQIQISLTNEREDIERKLKKELDEC